MMIRELKKVRNTNRVRGSSQARNGHIEGATAPAPDNIYQTVGTNTIKPPSTLLVVQEMDVTRLPSYSEATKMKTESPPDYRQLFSSSIFLR
jgi:hypothetical protein